MKPEAAVEGLRGDKRDPHADRERPIWDPFLLQRDGEWNGDGLPIES